MKNNWIFYDTVGGSAERVKMPCFCLSSAANLWQKNIDRKHRSHYNIIPFDVWIIQSRPWRAATLDYNNVQGFRGVIFSRPSRLLFRRRKKQRYVHNVAAISTRYTYIIFQKSLYCDPNTSKRHKCIMHKKKKNLKNSKYLPFFYTTFFDDPRRRRRAQHWHSSLSNFSYQKIL